MSELTLVDELSLDSGRAALIIQDMQNDVIIEGGAFAESGSPRHATEQNVVANVADLAAACRAKGIPVIHVHYIVEPGAPGPEAERAALQRRQGHRCARSRHLGCGRRRRPRAAGRRLRRREDADERLAGHEAPEPARRPRPRHGDRHGRVDEHVDRAHLAHGSRHGLLDDRARGRLLDDERRLAPGGDQLRAPERLPGDELRRGEGSARRSAERIRAHP